MGIENGFNPNPINKKILSDVSPAKGPQLSPPESKELEDKPKSPNSNLAYSAFNFNPSLVSNNEKDQIQESKNNTSRTGPGNLPGRSSVTYDLSEVDLTGYDDDDDGNSFTV